MFLPHPWSVKDEELFRTKKHIKLLFQMLNDSSRFDTEAVRPVSIERVTDASGSIPIPWRLLPCLCG